jgi:hypothetical protein
MAPPGTKVLIHEKPQKRGSWDPHGIEGWYLGPARQHYRCYQIFAIKTKATRITDTVKCFPTKPKIPYTTPTDVAIQAAHDLIQVVQQKQPSTAFAHIGTNQLEAIKQIAGIFNNHIKTQEPEKTNMNNQPVPSKLPRVPTPITPTLPRVPTTEARIPKHRYPTRNIISQTQDEMNHVEHVTPMAARHCIKMRENSITPTDDSFFVQQWVNTIIDPATGASMEYRHLIKHPKYSKIWAQLFSNEIGRLAQGVGGQIEWTDTINFIEYNKVPIDRRKDVTYGNKVVDNRRPKKKKKTEHD